MSRSGSKGIKAINPTRSPHLLVSIGMVLLGLMGLLLLQVLLIAEAPTVFGPYRFNYATLTAVHLFTLGFATTVMTGAFFQLTPVMMLAQPVGGRWAAVQALLYLVGEVLLILGFYAYNTAWIAAGGTLVVLALILFMILLGRCMRTATQWTISGTYMVVALSFLAGTILWGLTLALNLRWGFLGDPGNNASLGAHLVLGLGGWFMLSIFGVTYQLIPMFALSSHKDDRSARKALVLLTAGLWAAYAALALRLPARTAVLALLVALAGVAVYAVDMAGILRRRRHPELDLGMRYVMTAFGFLAFALPLLAIGAVSWLGASIAGVWFFLPGFVASMILGMLYKIVTFRFWHHLMENRTHKAQRLPKLTDMYSKRLAEAGYWLWSSGVVLTGLLLLAAPLGLPIGILRLPLAVSGMGSLLFVINMAQTLRAKPLS